MSVRTLIAEAVEARRLVAMSLQEQAYLIASSVIVQAPWHDAEPRYMKFMQARAAEAHRAATEAVDRWLEASAHQAAMTILDANEYGFASHEIGRLHRELEKLMHSDTAHQRLAIERGELLTKALNDREEMYEKARKQRDCGQADVCAIAPGCSKHWEERNCELLARATKAEAERDREAGRDYWCEACAVPSQSNEDGTCLVCGGDLSHITELAASPRRLETAEEHNRELLARAEQAERLLDRTMKQLLDDGRATDALGMLLENVAAHVQLFGGAPRPTYEALWKINEMNHAHYKQALQRAENAERELARTKHMHRTDPSQALDRKLIRLVADGDGFVHSGDVLRLLDDVERAEQEVAIERRAYTDAIAERDEARKFYRNGSCSENCSRICHNLGCTSGIVRRDDGTRVCVSGHEGRWVDRADLEAAHAERAALKKQNEEYLAALWLLAEETAFVRTEWERDRPGSMTSEEHSANFKAIWPVAIDNGIPPRLVICCSDTFHYASADAERAEYPQATEILALMKAEGWPGVVRWVQKNGQRGEPIESVVKQMATIDSMRAERDAAQAALANVGDALITLERDHVHDLSKNAQAIVHRAIEDSKWMKEPEFTERYESHRKTIRELRGQLAGYGCELLCGADANGEPYAIRGNSGAITYAQERFAQADESIALHIEVEALKAERDEARETQKALHRRTQEAEALAESRAAMAHACCGSCDYVNGIARAEKAEAALDARPNITREDARAYCLYAVASHDQEWGLTLAGYERVDAALREHAKGAKP